MRKRRAEYSKKQGIIFISSICFIAGLLLGGISIKAKSPAEYGQVSSGMESYLENYKKSNIDKGKMFRESAFKYGVWVAIIWVLGFIPIGGLLIFILIMLKGANYGFTTLLLISMFGSSGVITAFIMYIPQSIIIVPTYFFMTFSGINFILYNINNKREFKTPIRMKILKEYAITLFIGMVLTSSVAFVDAFIVPQVVEMIL